MNGEIILAQAEQGATQPQGPTVAVIGSPEAATADIVVSSDYTIIGIFMIWAGLIAFGWILVRRVQQGAFKMDPKLKEKADPNIPFKPMDKALSFIGVMLMFSGFGLVLMDLFRG